MKTEDISVVMVDREQHNIKPYLEKLELERFNLRYFTSPEQAIRHLVEEKANIIISEMDFENVTKDENTESGIEFYRQIKDKYLADRVIIFSSHNGSWPTEKNSFHFNYYSQFIEHVEEQGDLYFQKFDVTTASLVKIVNKIIKNNYQLTE